MPDKWIVWYVGWHLKVTKRGISNLTVPVMHICGDRGLWCNELTNVNLHELTTFHWDCMATAAKHSRQSCIIIYEIQVEINVLRQYLLRYEFCLLNITSPAFLLLDLCFLIKCLALRTIIFFQSFCINSLNLLRPNVHVYTAFWDYISRSLNVEHSVLTFIYILIILLNNV